jgi:hypothetical protein
MPSIYASNRLGERGRRNALRQLNTHKAFIAGRKYTGPTADADRAADLQELARLEKRLQSGENHCNW